MNSRKLQYKYKKDESIIRESPDEYTLNPQEYHRLYSFFVTYSMCGKQSEKKRTITDYGWDENNIVKSGLKAELEKVLKLDGSDAFCFKTDDDLKNAFSEHDLNNGRLQDIDIERAVIGLTPGDSKYFKLFYRIRDGLAHGSFSLRLDSKSNRVIVIQDQDHYNVKARIVMKLETLFQLIGKIDKKHLIQSDETIETKGVA